MVPRTRWAHPPTAPGGQGRLLLWGPQAQHSRGIEGHTTPHWPLQTVPGPLGQDGRVQEVRHWGDILLTDEAPKVYEIEKLYTVCRKQWLPIADLEPGVEVVNKDEADCVDCPGCLEFLATEVEHALDEPQVDALLAHGKGLDSIAQLWGIIRTSGESDTDLRARALAYVQGLL